MALAREELGAVQAAGFDADEDAAGGRGGHGDGFEAEDVGPAGGARDGRAHRFGGHCFVCCWAMCVCVCSRLVGWMGWRIACCLLWFA